jgi:hypothetical protein
VRRCDPCELVANKGENEVLPDTICDALSKAKDPLSAGEVERILPYRAADALVEEEVVGCGQEGRGRMEVGPEGPKGLDRGKGGYLLDALFIVGDFISWRALLAEPEDPSVCRAVTTTLYARVSIGHQMKEGRTYVLRRGWTDNVGSPDDEVAGLFSLTVEPFCSSERVVEKCFEGTRAAAGVAPENEEAVVVVTTVVDEICESLSLFERKRD